MHGSMLVQPIDTSLTDRIASFLKNGDIQEAQKKFKYYLIDLSHFPRPVDVNAEIFVILDKAFLRQDPELKVRLNSFADAIGSLETNRAQTQSLQSQLADCQQSQGELVLNLCDANLTQELNGRISALATEATSLQDKAQQEQQKLYEAFDRREEALTFLSDILQKMEATADGVIQNMK